MTTMQTQLSVTFTVNGASTRIEAFPMARLLDVLRENLGLTGSKEGCGEGECGACAVLVNGELVNSCLVPIAQVAGAEVTTIEGLAASAQSSATLNQSSGTLHPLQAAFLQAGGAQCGICTPGMLLAAAALLHTCPEPTEADIRTALAGNLCRCTGYTKIIEAVQVAAQALRQNGLPSMKSPVQPFGGPAGQHKHLEGPHS